MTGVGIELSQTLVWTAKNTLYLRLFKEPQKGQIVENKDIDVHHRKENMFLCSNKNINQSEGKANAMFVQYM